MARLAEIAYRSGDRQGALAALDEASMAADRHGVLDARAFVLLLRGHIALDEQDPTCARELCDAARAAAARGTVPPQFTAALSMLDASVTAAESGPERGLPMLADTLRRAVADQCSEAVTSAVVDSAAGLLGRLADFPRTARLPAAGDRLRGGHPRSLPEHTCADRSASAVRKALGAERYEAERTRGEAFTVQDALEELDEAVRAHSADTSRNR